MRKLVVSNQFPEGQVALESQIAAYQTAKIAHKSTVGVPAPTAHYLVEDIVNNFGGLFDWQEATPPEGES